MSESVRVDLREATLSESASLREGEPAFIGLDSPPPVRSLLRVIVGEDVRVFEVDRVIEVVEDGEPSRGCYGNFVDAARLEEQQRVGSEHLQPGISNSGVPAPVVIMNTTDMMMMAEAGEDGEPAAESDASEGDADGDETATDGDETDGDATDGAAEDSGAEGESDDAPSPDDEDPSTDEG